MLRRDVKLLASCFSLGLLLAATAMAQSPLAFLTTPTCSTGTGGPNNPCVLLPAAVGTQFSETLSVTGGTPPYTWTLISGTLPVGMNLNPSTGLLSAQNLSSTPGNTVFQVQVSDSVGTTPVSQNFILNVATGLNSRGRTGVLPQIATGAGWGTTIFLSNTTSSIASAEINFREPGGSFTAIPVSVQQPGFAAMTTTSSSLDFVMPANSTIVIQNTNSSAPVLLQGWADVQTTGGVSAYAIFRQTFPAGAVAAFPNGGFTEGVAAQQGSFSATITLPFDNTNGIVTAVALASISNLPPDITATVYNVNGTATSYPVPPTGSLSTNGQTTFTLPDNYPASANTRGFIVFQNLNDVNGQGTISGLALRFNSGVFVSLPAFASVTP
jgi:large repetitive protein